MMGHTARNNTVKKSDPGMWAPLRRSKAVHTLGEFRFTSEMRRINAAASPKIIGPQTFAKRPYADALTPTVNEYNRLFSSIEARAFEARACVYGVVLEVIPMRRAESQTISPQPEATVARPANIRERGFSPSGGRDWAARESNIEHGEPKK